MKCSCGKIFIKKDTLELFESTVAGFSYDKLGVPMCLECALERFREIRRSSNFICEECGGEFHFGIEYEQFESECEGGYDPQVYAKFSEKIVCWECAKNYLN